MRYSFIALLLLALPLGAQESAEPFSAKTFKGLEFRNIGPAFTSGRIADIAIHPENENCWYVAVGSGGVWKTTNAGITWKPIFDDQPSYSIGCVTIDPLNPGTIWVGTGENVGGRHVGFGDGIYRSDDGGKSWKQMGLENSEHISRILVHPDNSDFILVAAQGPLWNKGGDRGLYRSLDGGGSWEKVLGDNEWTGATEVVFDPADPGWIYAATWQRHRNVAAYMGGGPGTGIYRSSDGGETWEKLSRGLPDSNMGKIGLAVSPFDRNVIYAAIELDRRRGGLFISRDRGASWSKQSEIVSGGTGPHYYQELYVSPHYEGTLYLADVRMQVSDDHGKTFRRMEEDYKHSDNHSLNFRVDDPDYLLVGTDGGIYESYDLGEHWRFVANLPITQYYKLAVDDSEPFYFIYGGTQDNGSHGGPSRTTNVHGIRNADWFKILGADGHQTATEPGNPGIVYAESQQGGIHRIDRVTGDQVYVQPQAGEGEPHERFNWDTPILVSPHDPARIYTASYRVWRSDNRGDSWRAISDDLTRDQERIELPVMGRRQSWDNPWDFYAMSTYNTITSLAESPLQEGLICAGTDDGIIQVTEDGGENWRKTEVGSIPGIPSTAFVNDIRADLFDAQTVYAALDNHKFGDFKPYLVKSTDAGRSWSMITGDLPERLLVWRLVQDHQVSDLLFLATEFGVYFTRDGGRRWIELGGGTPTIAFRDITVQRRENDLVGATFGRGFYILDDYTPLRQATPEFLDQEAALFPVRDAWWYIPDNIVSAQGASDYRAGNPPFGALFTYYLREEVSTLREKRQEREKELDREKSDIPFPGWDELDRELGEDQPFLVFVVTNEQEEVVNRVTAPARKGIHRVSWNLRHASSRPVEPGSSEKISTSSGYLATPGTYRVTMALSTEEGMEVLTEPRSFRVKPLQEGVLEGPGYGEMDRYRREVEKAVEQLQKARHRLELAQKRISGMKLAYFRIDMENPDLLDRILQVQKRGEELYRSLHGSPSREEVGEKQPPGPANRISVATRGLSTTYGPTPLHRENLELGLKELQPVKDELDVLFEEVIPALEQDLREAGAPWIEGQQ